MELVQRVYDTGKEYCGMKARPLVFASRMQRETAFSLGASRRDLDGGFLDAADLRLFIHERADKAGLFRVMQGDESDLLVADGKWKLFIINV